MLQYFIKRLLTMIPMLLLISIIIYGTMELTPGDPLSSILSAEQAAKLTLEQKEAFREAVGLNSPLPLRYIKWLSRTLRGDFGNSLTSGAPVAKILAARIPATLELAGAALIISTLLGVILGVIAAINQNKPIDYILTSIGVFGISIPEFFFGIVAVQIFSIKLGWLPTGGRTVISASSAFQVLSPYVLPVLVLGSALMANLIRYTRGSMLDVLNKDYIKTALAKGMPATHVFIKHALRNALQPITNLICFRLPILIGGSVIIEQVFIWPGMGQTILNSISSKDFPTVLVCTMLSAAVVLIVSFMVDIITAFLDPRVRIR